MLFQDEYNHRQINLSPLRDATENCRCPCNLKANAVLGNKSSHMISWSLKAMIMLMDSTKALAKVVAASLFFTFSCSYSKQGVGHRADRRRK